MKFELNEYHKNISKDELLEDLCIVAKKLNKSYLSRSEYEKNGKCSAKYSLQGTTQGRYLTGGVPPVRFSM